MGTRSSRLKNWMSLLYAGGIALLAIAALSILYPHPTVILRCWKSRYTACPNSLHRLGMAYSMYLQDYEERFPPFREWNQRISPYIGGVSRFYCPTELPDALNVYYYAAFVPLKLRPLQQIDNSETTPLLYDSTCIHPSPYDYLTSLPEPERHDRRNNVLYVDGSVKRMRNHQVRQQGDAAVTALRQEIFESSRTPPSKSP